MPSSPFFHLSGIYHYFAALSCLLCSVYATSESSHSAANISAGDLFRCAGRKSSGKCPFGATFVDIGDLAYSSGVNVPNSETIQQPFAPTGYAGLISSMSVVFRKFLLVGKKICQRLGSVLACASRPVAQDDFEHRISLISCP